MEILLEAAEWGEDVHLTEVLEMIDAVVARPQLRAALAEVTGTVLKGGRSRRTVLLSTIYTVMQDGRALMASTRRETGAFFFLEPVITIVEHYSELTQLSR